MSLDGIGGRPRAGGYSGDSTGPTQRVGTTPTQAGQAGQAEGAAGAGAVGGVDVPKVVNDIAQSLGRAADKFRMLTGVNQFSAQAAPFMKMLGDGQKAIMDTFNQWSKAVQSGAAEGKQAVSEAVHDGKQAIDQAIDDWGKSIREQAEKDKTAHLEDQLKKQQIGPQYTKSAPSQTNPANLAE